MVYLNIAMKETISDLLSAKRHKDYYRTHACQVHFNTSMLENQHSLSPLSHPVITLRHVLHKVV
jgi:hypothetical protein